MANQVYLILLFHGITLNIEIVGIVTLHVVTLGHRQSDHQSTSCKNSIIFPLPCIIPSIGLLRSLYIFGKLCS